MTSRHLANVWYTRGWKVESLLCVCIGQGFRGTHNMPTALCVGVCVFIYIYLWSPAAGCKIIYWSERALQPPLWSITQIFLIPRSAFWNKMREPVLLSGVRWSGEQLAGTHDVTCKGVIYLIPLASEGGARIICVCVTFSFCNHATALSHLWRARQQHGQLRPHTRECAGHWHLFEKNKQMRINIHTALALCHCAK